MGKHESEIGGNLSPKRWEVAPDFDSRFGRIEATDDWHTLKSKMKQGVLPWEGVTVAVCRTLASREPYTATTATPATVLFD